MHVADHRSILFVSAFLLLVDPFVEKGSAGGTVAQPNTVERDNRLAQNGFLKINGAPRLIIGLYELPRDEEQLAEMAANGFNLVRAPQDSGVLDRVQKHGLYAWICLGSMVQLDRNNAEGEQRLAGTINQFKEHPALLVWELPDEALWNIWWYNQMVDAAGCDIYPVPFNYGVGHSDLKDTNLSSVGVYTDRMREAAPGKAIWMVLQGFGWRDLGKEGKNDPDPAKGRRPRFAETRFMAYDALVHGAHALLYWGTDYIEKDSVLWKDLMKTAKELRTLEPALVGRRVEGTPMAVADETYGSVDGQGPTLMLRRAADNWVLVAVNECTQGVSFRVQQLPKEMEGRTLYRLYSEESQVVTKGSFRDGIRGLGVHVYATSREFESK